MNGLIKTVWKNSPEWKANRVNRYLPTCCGNTIAPISHLQILFAQAKKVATNSELGDSGSNNSTWKPPLPHPHGRVEVYSQGSLAQLFSRSKLLRSCIKRKAIYTRWAVFRSVTHSLETGRLMQALNANFSTENVFKGWERLPENRKWFPQEGRSKAWKVCKASVG